MVGATEPAGDGGVAADAGAARGQALFIETAAEFVDEATEPADGGGAATGAKGG